MQDLNIECSAADSVTKKLPTLNQWLRTLGKSKMAKCYILTTVWLPNQYPNFTFETEKFRVRVSEDNPMYKNLRKAVLEWYQGDVAVAISVSEERDGAFKFVALEENVEWSEVGSSGYRIKVLAKRDRTKSVGDSKPRVDGHV